LADFADIRSAGGAKSHTGSAVSEKLQRAESLLPVHSRMFEKHRVNHMHSLLLNVVYSEMSYHCRVIEELTPVLESLTSINANYEITDDVVS